MCKQQQLMCTFFLVTGLHRLTPGQHLAVLFSNRLRNLAFFFVPGVNRASPISTRAKTVDLPGVRGEYAIS